MKFNHYPLAFLFLLTPLFLAAQAESLFNDIRMEMSLQEVTQKINEISASSTAFHVDEPTFPLAKTKEAHLVGLQVETEQGTIQRIVFTFADNKLSYIQAKGNVIKTLTSNLTDTARTYLDYDVYSAQKLFIKKNEDMAWILTEEALHPNLFAWNNPYLDKAYTDTISETTRVIPTFIKMGATYEELKPLLETNSKFTNRFELDGSDPNAQFQVDCFGVDYMGFPRKIEARFGDNVLNVVWILTGKGEEDRIRTALIKEFGSPIFVTDEWEIFNNWQVGLRKDKPEVLLMEKEVGLAYKTSYFKQ